MKRSLVASGGIAGQNRASQRNMQPASEKRWNQFIRWSGWGAVVGPILFVLIYTIAGFLRPGYSPIQKAISDLGVGPNAWLLNIPAVMLGLTLVAFAAGFSQAMRPVMSSVWSWICGVLVALPGAGLAVAGIFTAARATLLIHWMVGATLGLYFPVITFFVVGFLLIHLPAWRGYGIYSLVASVATIAAIVFLQLAFTPGAALSGLQIGGLAERVDLIEVHVWYVVMGWRLVHLPLTS